MTRDLATALATLPARLRKKRGCRSLRDVAPEIGVSFSTLSRIEHGMVPNGKALYAIEQWLVEETSPTVSIEQEIAHVHVEINAASDAFRQRLHDAVCSWQDVHRQNQELQALVNRQRAEIERLQQECTERNAALESYRALACGRIAELEAERSDLRRANRAYAKTLTDIRGALGAVDDADLVEVAQKTVHVIEQTDLFRQRHIAERDRALAECERLRAGIALARAYKAAVDGLNGVADAEAALFAWLEENDHVPHP